MTCRGPLSCYSGGCRTPQGAGQREGARKTAARLRQPDTYLVKALRESSSEDVAEAGMDSTGGCSAENRFKLVALGRKESARGCGGE